MENPQLNWMPYVVSSPGIKVETSESNNVLISPPSTPHPSSLSVTSSSTSRRRGSTSSLAGSRRPRPYPSVAHDFINSRNRRAKSDTAMSNQFNPWSTMQSGSSRAPGRRSSDEEQTPDYNNMAPYMDDYLNMSEGPATSELTPPSSSSSLSGAVGGDNSRNSRSPPHTAVYGGHGSMQPADLTWNNQQMSTNVGMVTSMSNAYSNVASSFPPSVNAPYDYTTRHASPSESTSSQHGQAYPPSYDYRGLSSNPMGMSYRSSAFNPGNPLSAPFPQPAELPVAPMASNPAEAEIRRLRRRIRELEMENSRARNALESMRNSVPNVAGQPTHPHSTSFQAGWKLRTDARKKLFCSLNRAGNALCAWHDSRRERRAYPPRNAPHGFLNCGCTYEQALFEESLARHGVGSYHPGETVRMDPALRNPLLKLLEQRYGYKDGDFEHDPLTEEWHEDESPAIWEQKVLSGQTVRRRPDSHSHDRR